MSERGLQLQETADRQLSELIDLFATWGEAALSLPCPGREKLGVGTVAATAMHTAENYNRIAGFIQANDHMQRADAQTECGRRRDTTFKRAQGHGDGMHDSHSSHGGDYRAETVSLRGLLDRFSAGQAALSSLAELTDQQLDLVPPDSDMKFSDGHRTLELIVTNLLKHQRHQIDALKAAMG